MHLGLWEIIIIFICLREGKQDDKGLFYNLVLGRYLNKLPPFLGGGVREKGTGIPAVYPSSFSGTRVTNFCSEMKSCSSVCIPGRTRWKETIQAFQERKERMICVYCLFSYANIGMHYFE